jgi:AAA+ ATPase superfamily predicted ATPase
MVGRDYELKILRKALGSKRAELGIVYGRRRVGKSYLLKSLLKVKTDLYFEGIKGLNEQEQINHFLDQLAEQTQTLPYRANTWKQALEGLTKHIETRACYIIIDELPWMASQKTELIAWLKYFWDNHWQKNNRLKIVLCGSIANFMIKHVVHSEALHNRKTLEIHLQPLLAFEAVNFFKKSKSDQEMLKYLMCFGGIPKYLEQIDTTLSFNQNVNNLCFNKSGFFIDEFETIFKEQFKVTKKYEKIIRTLVNKAQSKEEISETLKISSGGSLSLALDNLERAGFIKKHSSIYWSDRAKEKTNKYFIWDEWLRFYFTLMAPHMKLIRLNTGAGLFEKLSQNQLSSFWGRAFERLIEKNLPQLLNHLDIELGDILTYGPYFQQGARRLGGGERPGVQIDLVLKKRDNTICLIECKFTEKPVGIEVATEMAEKIERLTIPKKWSVQTILISATGVTSELRKAESFDHILDLKAIL